jgi:hypothetical protein
VVLLLVEDLRVVAQVDLQLHVMTQVLLLARKVAPNLRRQLRNKIK